MVDPCFCFLCIVSLFFVLFLLFLFVTERVVKNPSKEIFPANGFAWFLQVDITQYIKHGEEYQGLTEKDNHFGTILGRNFQKRYCLIPLIKLLQDLCHVCKPGFVLIIRSLFQSTYELSEENIRIEKIVTSTQWVWKIKVRRISSKLKA